MKCFEEKDALLCWKVICDEMNGFKNCYDNMVVATINIQVIDSSCLASGDAGLWTRAEVF